MIHGALGLILGAFLIAYSYELPEPDSWFFGYAGIILYISGIILLFIHFNKANIYRGRDEN